MIKTNSKPVNNDVCAYRDCNAKSEIRLYFMLGFSALFCDKCAEKLLTSNIAKRVSEGYTEQLQV